MGKMSFRDRVRQRAKENERKGGGIYKPGVDLDFFKIKKETYQLDVIPYTVKEKNLEEIPIGEMWFRKVVLIHRVNNKRIVCPRTIGKPCPICEYRDELMKTPGYDKKEAQEANTQKRELYRVINVGAGEEKIQLWEVSRGNFGEVLDEEIRENTDETVGSFAELKEGLTLKIRVVEDSFVDPQGKKTVFLKASRIDFLERKDGDYPKSILDEAPHLDDIINVLDYKVIEQAFYGEEGLPEPLEEAAPEELEDVGRSRTRARGKDAEEEPPARSRKRDPEPEEEPEPEKTRTRGRKEPEEEPEPEKTTRSKAGGHKCPFGGEFGTDNNELKECEECDQATWEACCDEKDRLEKAEKDEPPARSRKKEPEPEPETEPEPERTRTRTRSRR